MSETKVNEKRVVRRSVFITLGIICIVLIAGLGGAITYYTMQINDKDTAYNNYILSHSHTDSEFDWLNSTYQDYMASHSHFNSAYDSLSAPRPIPINLEGEDNRTLPQTPSLHVHGFLCNGGYATAYNCTLHVIAYQDGGVVANDTYIDLGLIMGQSYATVDANVKYEGVVLSGWSIMTFYATSP